MPWDRNYDIYRAQRCIEQGDLDGALRWFQKAGLPLPAQEGPDGE
jgi:hypothetical protein